MQTAIVTGGADPLPFAIASRLAVEGWRVVLAGAGGAALDAATRKLEHSEAIALDVTDLDAAARAITGVRARHGALNALVNAAGGREGADAGPFCDSDPASWARLTDLHLRSVMGWCRAATPALAASGGGSIVSVVAFEAMRGNPSGAVFSTAQAGVVVFNQMLAIEVQSLGIRANTLIAAPPEALARARHQDPHQGAADGVSHLLSQRARWTNGACLDITGGWALY